MHKHDLDLIAEYAAGTLGDETEARARVASCETCAGEYTAQSSVLNELSGIEPARMTEHERARLHRDLWTELRSPVAAPLRSASPWWRSWAFGAAAFIVVAVTLVGVMENFGGGDAAETFSEVGAALDADSGSTSGDARTNDEAAEDGEGGEEALAPDVTTAAAESYENTPYLLIAREVRQGTKIDSGDFAYDESETDCLEQSGLLDHMPVSGFESVTNLLVAVPSGADLEGVPVTFIDPENCTVVHIED